MDERERKRLERLMREKVELSEPDPGWPDRYAEVEAELKRLVPRMYMLRIAHIGSTSVPGLGGKPIVDVQVEVNDLEAIRRDVVPRLEDAGYEFVWRPSMGDSTPFYAWFIKRDAQGRRVVHVHMVPPGQASADRIAFRDHLREHPEMAARYLELKRDLAKRFARDREGYTRNKTAFVQEVLALARREKKKR